MNNQIKEIQNELQTFLNSVKNLTNKTHSLQSKDYAIKNYIMKINKLMLQHLDVIQETQRQLNFLTNEYNNSLRRGTFNKRRRR